MVVVVEDLEVAQAAGEVEIGKLSCDKDSLFSSSSFFKLLFVLLFDDEMT